MRARNIIYIIICLSEIALILYLSIRKSNHTLPGYLLLGATSIVLVLTVWLMLFPRYEDIAPTGANEIKYIEENYTDESRIEEFKNDGSKRELQIGVWYPLDKENNSCPLVIFSHGSFGTINNNKTLCTELASRGYVVVSVSHTYHAFETTLSDGTKVRMSSEFRNEILKENPHKNPEQSVVNYKKWMKLRIDDLSFILDTVKGKVSSNHEAYKLIDTTKIIAMGHSMGGNAALGLPRYRNDITAVVALESSFMCDITGVENGKFTFIEDEYPVPVLNIYSDSSYSHLNEWSQYQENYNLLNSDNPKYTNVYLSGIGHMHLCDFQLQSPFLSWVLSGTDTNYSAKENLKKINDTVLDFLKQNNLPN